MQSPAEQPPSTAGPILKKRHALVAAFLVGLLSILLLLLTSWFLRAIPGVASMNVTTAESLMARPPPPARPDPTPLLRASLADLQADQTRLAAQLAALNADVRHKAEQCRTAAAPPVQAPQAQVPQVQVPQVPPPQPKPAPAPPPPPQLAQAPPPPSAPPPLPIDRWTKKDLGVLQGCWSLGREAPTVVGGGSGREDCTTKVGRICFDANGHGEREQTISCPRAGTMRCRAPVTGQFAADGTFGTRQGDVQCQGGARTMWLGRTLSCRRVDDSQAACRDSGRPELGYPAQDQEFRRAP